MDEYMNELAQFYYNKDYEELTPNEKEIIENQLQYKKGGIPFANSLVGKLTKARIILSLQMN